METFTIIPKWLVGIGTLFLGIGALIAANQTKDILNHVLEIKSQANIIQKNLKSGVAELKITVNNLRNEIKYSSAQNAIAESDVLKSPDANQTDIENALKTISLNQNIILPKNKIAKTAQELSAVKGTNQRIKILENALQYVPNNK